MLMVRAGRCVNGSRERCAGAQLCRGFQAVKRESGFDLKYNAWASQVEPVIKNLPANARDTRDAGSIPELGRSPGVRNGNPFQYSCLENSMDRGAWWATVHGATKSQTQLND